MRLQLLQKLILLLLWGAGLSVPLQQHHDQLWLLLVRWPRPALLQGRRLQFGRLPEHAEVRSLREHLRMRPWAVFDRDIDGNFHVDGNLHLHLGGQRHLSVDGRAAKSGYLWPHRS